MITLEFTRSELERLYRDGEAAAMPADWGMAPELAAAIADIILAQMFGGNYL